MPGRPISGWLQDSHSWPGIKAVGMINATRETDGATRALTRYYMLSQAFDPARLNATVRSHWGIENRLRWVLDAIMGEDQARNRKDNGPQNLARLRRLAPDFAKLEPSKGAMRGKLKRAGWDTPFLFGLLALFAHPWMQLPWLAAGACLTSAACPTMFRESQGWNCTGP